MTNSGGFIVPVPFPFVPIESFGLTGERKGDAGSGTGSGSGSVTWKIGGDEPVEGSTIWTAGGSGGVSNTTAMAGAGLTLLLLIMFKDEGVGFFDMLENNGFGRFFSFVVLVKVKRLSGDTSLICNK